MLVEENGGRRPEPWLDNTKMYSAAGILVRLTAGLRGCPVWVTPDATGHHPDVLKARAFKYGGTICSIGEAATGSLADLLPVPQPPADPGIVAALARYVREPAGGP